MALMGIHHWSVPSSARPPLAVHILGVLSLTEPHGLCFLKRSRCDVTISDQLVT